MNQCDKLMIKKETDPPYVISLEFVVDTVKISPTFFAETNRVVVFRNRTGHLRLHLCCHTSCRGTNNCLSPDNCDFVSDLRSWCLVRMPDHPGQETRG